MVTNNKHKITKYIIYISIPASEIERHPAVRATCFKQIFADMKQRQPGRLAIPMT